MDVVSSSSSELHSARGFYLHEEKHLDGLPFYRRNSACLSAYDGLMDIS